MTRRFIAPDNGVKQVAIEGIRTGATEVIGRDRKGFFQATDKRQADALKAEGFIEASLSGVGTTARGFICSGCGFHGWFKKCGRCGCDEVEKDGEE